MQSDIKPYRRVRVTRDFPEQNVNVGLEGWVVDLAQHPDGGPDGAFVETMINDEQDVIVVPVDALELVEPNATD